MRRWADIRCVGLSAPVGLHDIRDLDRFVGAIIARHPVLGATRGDERQELEAEAYLLVVDRFEHRWDGRGTFSGYVTRYLAAALTDHLHRMRWHVRRHSDGPRVWDCQAVLSWEAELERVAVAA